MKLGVGIGLGACRSSSPAEPPPDIVIVNVWRRAPSGRINTQSMTRKQNGDAAPVIAAQFFEA